MNKKTKEIVQNLKKYIDGDEEMKISKKNILRDRNEESKKLKKKIEKKEKFVEIELEDKNFDLVDTFSPPPPPPDLKSFTSQNNLQKPQDNRNDLLASIRKGTNLTLKN
jgi:hypothetical protein